MLKDMSKEIIKQLIEKYNKVIDENRLRGYNEEMTKQHFILPFFRALGWDTEDDKEVRAEDNIKLSGRADYSFILNGQVKFYLEAKALKEDLNREDFAKQAIRYAWNKGVDWAVLTDFESVKVFNAQALSNFLADKLVFEIKMTDYLTDERLFLLSKDAFSKNQLTEYAVKVGKKLPKVSVGEQLFKDLNECRRALTDSLIHWIPKKDKDLLDEGVQRILDRLIFIRVAEDRGLEPPNTLRSLAHQWRADIKNKVTLFQSLIGKFRELDDIYNSNLFSEHPCERWEDDSGVVEKIIKRLYGQEGYYEYDFKYIPADVLGSVYESYLGYIAQKPIKPDVTGKSGRLFEIEDKAEIKMKSRQKRKEQGIYYTPTFIVDYIVKNTLGKVLENCHSVNDLKKIKVLDPACGSGSFLIKALAAFSEKYKDFDAKIVDQSIKSSILLDNIYGVDLDEQAVELARLNLLINALDKKQKLPMLTQNIKCGNSLISGTDAELKKYFGENWRDKKPFNWSEEFEEVFRQGGFDVIIGNPPWGANIDNELQFFAEKFPASTQEKKDIYKIFIERAITLLKPMGFLGFIVPNSFLYQPSYEDIKHLISQYNYVVVNLGDKIFKDVTVPCCILAIQKRKKRKGMVIDLSKEDRTLLPDKLLLLDFKKEQINERLKLSILKKTQLTFGDVFILKDAGIQYHRSGIGLSNKGGNDLFERIFCKKSEHKFEESKGTYYGKLMLRYYISDKTDELFNLNYKKVLSKNESVSFTRDAFEQKQKILWRQTAPTIFATIDKEKRWFRNTIQCGWVKDEYTKNVDILYALAIFNSKYIDYIYRQKVLETGRVFPQVKIKYLQELPFVIATKDKQGELVSLVIKMLDLNKQLQSTPENSNKWQAIKSEIERIDKLIDQKVYKLYGLSGEEIKMVEGGK